MWVIKYIYVEDGDRFFIFNEDGVWGGKCRW